jgi:hypothetical protein
MIDKLNQALEGYFKAWDELVQDRGNQAFFTGLTCTSLGWKTEDLEEFNVLAAELREKSEQVHFGWVNDRWIGTFYLRNDRLARGLKVVKLMQRRPGSSDAVGLDHVDFYFVPGSANAKEIMQAESGLEWTEEKNGEHCKWISIWFDGTEAKIRSDTVLNICAQEMKDCEAKLLA